MRVVIETYCFDRLLRHLFDLFLYTMAHHTHSPWCCCGAGVYNFVHHTFRIAIRIRARVKLFTSDRAMEIERVRTKSCQMTNSGTLYDENFVRSWCHRCESHAAAAQAAVAPFFALDSFPFCLNRFFINIIKMRWVSTEDECLWSLMSYGWLLTCDAMWWSKLVQHTTTLDSLL